MLKKIQTAIDKLASHIGVWPQIFGVISMSAITGYAAFITEALRPYAPFSWVCAALLAGIFFSIIFLAYARARLWLTQREVLDDFYKSNDRINPLETTFRNQRINISDLVSPIDSYVRGKTFIDCELIGPANITFSATQPGGSGLNGVGFINCDVCKLK